MKKIDFVQNAAMQFLPQVDWDMDKAIKYAERLWLRLEQRGYGNAKPSQPGNMVNYYQKLPPRSQKQFDQFWIAFDNKQGKQRAAMRWQQLGELTASELNSIIKAAKSTAAARKNLPPEQVPIMAEGWLSQRRFDDNTETSTEKTSKAKNQIALKIREITGALAHAKKMQSNTQDDFWPAEVERLTQQLKALR